MKAYTTEFFIERAKNVYGDKYVYDHTKYVNTEIPVIVTCPNHGDFQIRPLKFLKGRECQKCKTKTIRTTHRLTTEQFIENSKLVHGDKYDYSKSNYINQKTKVIVICPKHGEFEIVPNYHLSDKCGCKLCGKESIKEKTSYTAEYFIKQAIEIHGNKYCYSQVNYVDSKTKVELICHKHGSFFITPLHHINSKSGCNKCGIEKNSISKSYNQEKFIKKAKNIHIDKYDYSKSIYINSKEKITIICKKHGKFTQQPAMHLQGQGCPNCLNSIGENKIFLLLTQNNIEFKTQYKFDGCENKRRLPFDFYIPHLNICIEFQGAQHYSAYHHMGGKSAFKKLQINDQIKRDFCKNNNIVLLEIKYDEDIEEKLMKYNLI